MFIVGMMDYWLLEQIKAIKHKRCTHDDQRCIFLSLCSTEAFLRNSKSDTVSSLVDLAILNPIQNHLWWI